MHTDVMKNSNKLVCKNDHIKTKYIYIMYTGASLYLAKHFTTLRINGLVASIHSHIVWSPYVWSDLLRGSLNFHSGPG